MKRVSILICILLSIFIFLIGCEKNMIVKYNTKLYYNITESFRNVFVKEHITNGAFYENILYDDENIPKDYMILVKSENDAINIFNEIPFEIDFKKQNVIIYIYTTNYNSVKVKLTKVGLDNNVCTIYIKEKLGGIGTGSATRPTTKFIVVTLDKIDQYSYNFIVL